MIKNMLWILAFCLILNVSMSFGQGAGAMLGTVTDASGAMIPGVEITVTNQGTNQVRTGITNETGNYRVEPLMNGVYSVSAELAGFRKEVRTDIKVDVDARVRIDFKLEVGSVSEVVEVTGAAPVVQTDSSQVGTVVDERKILDLPLNGRNFSSLAYITPGTFAPRPGSHLADRGGFVAAGLAEKNNQFLLDGVNGNAAITMEPVIRVNVDAVAEFKIQTQNYNAQYGRYSGAQVDAVTKTGTNEFHGAVFGFTRNDNLDSRNFFEPTKSEFRRHQYGGVFGGPIIKDKLFFFAGYQGQRQQYTRTSSTTIPLPEFWSGNLSKLNKTIRDPQTGQPFPNGQIPANRISPIALGFRKYYDLGTYVNNNPVSNAVGIMDEPDNYNLPNFKVNTNFGPSHQLIVAWGGHFEKFNEWTFSRPVLPNFMEKGELKNQIFSVQEVWSISSKVINEFRIGMGRSYRLREPFLADKNYAQEHGIFGTANDYSPGAIKGQTLFGIPRISVSGYAPFGARTQQTRVDGNHMGSNNVSVLQGNHALKFGVDGFHQYVSSSRWFFDMGGIFTFNGAVTGDPFADFLLGLPDTTERKPPVPGSPTTAYPDRWSFNFFGQDDWKVSPTLTLNYGLRWELNNSMGEKFQRLSSFDPTIGGGRGGIRLVDGWEKRYQASIDLYKSLYPTLLFETADSYYQNDYNNLAPRLGFAWSPGGATTTVIRGGYGIFYNIDDVCFCDSYQLAPWGLNQRFTRAQGATLANPWPGATPQQPFGPPGSGPIGAIQVPTAAWDLVTEYTGHWNLDVQQELPGGVVVDVAYVGKKGTKIPGTRDINQPINGVFPYPLFGPISYQESIGSSIYHGLQLRVERRSSSGLTMLHSYAWAKYIDNVGACRDCYNLKAERGLGAEDMRHRYSGTFVYPLPGKGLTGIAGQVLGGWEAGGIVRMNSGVPLTPTLSTDNSGTGRRADRPDIIGDARHKGKIDPRVSFWPREAFVIPARGQFGNASRGSIVGPAYYGVDMNFSKRFKVQEGKDIQLRWEVYNLFNHANFVPPATVFNAATFGTIEFAQAPRQMQLGLKYTF